MTKLNAFFLSMSDMKMIYHLLDSNLIVRGYVVTKTKHIQLVLLSTHRKEKRTNDCSDDTFNDLQCYGQEKILLDFSKFHQHSADHDKS